MFNELNQGDEIVSVNTLETTPDTTAPSVWDEIKIGLLVGGIAAVLLLLLTIAVLAGAYWYGTFG